MKVMGQGMIVGSGPGRALPADRLQFNLSQHRHRLRADDAPGRERAGGAQLHANQ